MPLTFQPITGEGVSPWIPALAKLRVAVFRERTNREAVGAGL